MCKGGVGVWGQRRGGGLRQIKHLPQGPFSGQFFKVMTFGIAFYQTNLSMVRTRHWDCYIGWYREVRLYSTFRNSITVVHSQMYSFGTVVEGKGLGTLNGKNAVRTLSYHSMMMALTLWCLLTKSAEIDGGFHPILLTWFRYMILLCKLYKVNAWLANNMVCKIGLICLAQCAGLWYGLLRTFIVDYYIRIAKKLLTNLIM